MPSTTILLLPLATIAAYAFNWYLCFRRNIQKAKDSGLPYVVVPSSVQNQAWIITNPLWLKLAHTLLPKTWTQSWLDYSRFDLSWTLGYEPFQRLGSDTFMTVSGGDFSVWTADADVISQLVTRRHDFPKPSHRYVAMNIYGDNVLSAEGDEWRRHRKFISPPFTERNNHLVWSETISQTQTMVKSWLGKDSRGNRTATRIMDDTMRLSLHVISRAGFGRTLEWPEDQTASADAAETSIHPSKIENREADIDEGHSMSFVYALHSLLNRIFWLVMVHPSILKRSPLKAMRHAYQSQLEWGRYMSEMVSTKKAAIRAPTGMDDVEDMNIMGQLVKGQVSSLDDKSSNEDAPLSHSEILGNSFILIIAGHETSANSIHYAILLLALNGLAQQELQRDLASHFDGRPVSDWDYDKDLPALFGGMTCAVMNETLRVVSPVINVPKSTYGVGDQSLTVNGKTCTIPSNTYINICVASTHRNPKWWPNASSTGDKRSDDPAKDQVNDLDFFKPERWFLDAGDDGTAAQNDHSSSLQSKEAEDDTMGPNQGSGTSRALYRPHKTAFLPFSVGARACIGRRFAEVEILAALAVIFSQYSVELAVDKYATDEEVDKMDQQARRHVWDKAANDARWLIKSSTTILTLQMREGHVPVRLVRKGEERFGFPQ